MDAVSTKIRPVSAEKPLEVTESYRRQHLEIHSIQRSSLGRLTIRFEGGCSYPSMVESLKRVFRRSGCLIARGESLSGPHWVKRMLESGHSISKEDVEAVRTLMWKIRH